MPARSRSTTWTALAEFSRDIVCSRPCFMRCSMPCRRLRDSPQEATGWMHSPIPVCVPLLPRSDCAPRSSCSAIGLNTSVDPSAWKHSPSRPGAATWLQMKSLRATDSTAKMRRQPRSAPAICRWHRSGRRRSGIGGWPGKSRHAMFRHVWRWAHRSGLLQVPGSPVMFTQRTSSSYSVARRCKTRRCPSIGSAVGMVRRIVSIDSTLPVRALARSYRFDRFDLARARTGEGALAFGWGVYAAKSRGVAENYTGMHGIGGATVPTYFKIKGVLTEPRSPEQKAADLIHGLGLPGARKFARGMLEEARSGEPWTMDRGLDYYEAVARVTLDCEHKRDVERASGYLYEVDVPADGLLLWDAPMCDQPPEVLAALKAQGFGRGTNRAGEWLMHMWSSLGEGKFDEISSLAPGSSQEAMSRWLLSIGVHGIQYLDSASRGAVARGEFNFVFFSDDHVRIHRVTEAAPLRQRVA